MNRVPPTAVGAWDLLNLLPPDRWFEEGLAYLDCALALFGRMTAGELIPNWPRAKAAAFLFGHSLELFFKAAIAQTGAAFPWGHDLRRQHDHYRRSYPQEQYAFQSNVSGFIEENAPLPFYDFLKYPERVEEVNKTWDVTIHIDVAQWHHAISQTRDDFVRLWPLILEKYPRETVRYRDNVDGEFELPPWKRKKSADA
jgi:hypothetical protein